MGRRLTAVERREQLIRVGRQVFARHGYEATTVEEVARKAKVSKPIVYEHFGGKEGLYAVIVDREMANATDRMTRAISAGSPRQRLEQATLAFLTWVKEEPDGFNVLLRDKPLSGGSGMAGLLHDVAARVAGIFEQQFVQAGYDRRLAPMYAHALVGMVTYVGEWWMEARRPSVEVVAAHLAAMAWMGLRHLPEHPDPVEPAEPAE
jgi:AcrR family transcriptional regulator